MFWQFVKIRVQHLKKKWCGGETLSIWTGGCFKSWTVSVLRRADRRWSAREKRGHDRGRGCRTCPLSHAWWAQQSAAVSSAQGKWNPCSTLSHIYWRDHGNKSCRQEPVRGMAFTLLLPPISSVSLSKSVDGLCGMWVKEIKHRSHFHIILQRVVLTP